MSAHPKQANTEHPIHPVLAARWSPYAYADRSVSPEDLRSLFEAARWAASSYNEQPWSFLVARKEDAAGFATMLQCLVPPNREWAQNASVLVLTVISERYRRNQKENVVALHDLGLAVGNLSVEATHRGISVHQMGGILPDHAREVYAVPEHHSVRTALALGYPAPVEDLPEALRERETSPRERRPLDEQVFGGRHGDTASWLS